MDSIFQNAQVYCDNAFVEADVLVAAGKIAAIGPSLPTAGAQVVDCHGRMLVPGFIDLHTHGGAGVDVNAATTQDLQKLARFFASQGTTAWLASVLTDTQQQTRWCIGQIKAAMTDPTGAQLLGVHLEGPFLAPEFKGAMSEQLLQKGDRQLLQRYQEAAEGAIKYITLSPEVEGVPQLIDAVAQEIVVAIGHSGADYETAMDCIGRGARCITHTFNAMKLFHQHFPAIMGAALESDAYCEAICDGRHLHPGTVRMLLKAKGYHRVVAVTDSIMAAGLPDGSYKLGVNDVVVQDGDAKLACNGVRAGSTLTTIKALQNLVQFTGCSLEKCLPLLTLNPARALRIDDKKGSIAIGKDADLVLLNHRLAVCATYRQGIAVWSTPGQHPEPS